MPTTSEQWMQRSVDNMPPSQWFCTCIDPVTDEIGECRRCHRKPVALMLRVTNMRVEVQ